MNYDPIILPATDTGWVASITTASDSGALWINLLTAFGAAFLGAAFAEFFNARSRARDERARRRSLAFSILKKLETIYSDSFDYLASVRRADDRLAAAKSRWEKERRKPENAGEDAVLHLTQFAEPYTSLPADLEFTPDELYVLATSGDPEIQNATQGLDRRFNGILGGLRRFDIEREKASEERARIVQTKSIKGLTVSGSAKPEDGWRLKEHLTRLDDLLHQIRTLTEELIPETFTAIRMLVEAPNPPLGRGYRTDLPDPSGKVVKLDGSRTPAPRRWFEVWRPRRVRSETANHEEIRKAQERMREGPRRDQSEE